MSGVGLKVFWEEECDQKFDINKFYVCTNAYIFFYEKKDWSTKYMFSQMITKNPEQDQKEVEKWATVLTKRNKINYYYIKPNTPIFVLGIDGKYVHIMAEDKVGWMCLRQYLTFQELKNPNEEK